MCCILYSLISSHNLTFDPVIANDKIITFLLRTTLGSLCTLHVPFIFPINPVHVIQMYQVGWG